MSPFSTLEAITAAARQALDSELWDHTAGGAGTEASVEANRVALDRLLFAPRVLTAVGLPETATTFLGYELSVPVLLAPVGPAELFHPDGAAAVARGAGDAGSIALIAMTSSPAIEDVVASAAGPVFLQIYLWGDTDWIEGLVGRAEAAGVAGFVVTVDTVSFSRRPRDIRNDFSTSSLLQHANLDGVVRRTHGPRYQAAAGWEDFGRICEQTDLPVIIKGVTNGPDAIRAVDVGAAAVYISNHGGRFLDHQPGVADVFPEVAAAVADRAVPLVADGGVSSGDDVVKYLAMGATAVAIGRLQCWGLAAAGAAGVAAVIDLLRSGMQATMANLGISAVDSIDRSALWAPAHSW